MTDYLMTGAGAEVDYRVARIAEQLRGSRERRPAALRRAPAHRRWWGSWPVPHRRPAAA
jgi:hypothetical protein